MDHLLGMTNESRYFYFVFISKNSECVLKLIMNSSSLQLKLLPKNPKYLLKISLGILEEKWSNKRNNIQIGDFWGYEW